MKSRDLKKLNFQKLIGFKEHFLPKGLTAQYRYYPPRSCSSFCIDCEKKNLFESRHPYKLSHGADTEDIEKAMGAPLPTPSKGKFIDAPVMFLGIEPGGDYDTMELLQHPVQKAVRKCVPTKHYYWTTPPSAGWPTHWNDVTWVPGPFFAHVLSRFGLLNAYFTNIIKCRLREGNLEVNIKPDKRHVYDDSRIRRNCIENYLKKEINLFQPVVIFVFGIDGMKILSDEPWLKSETLVQLHHYAVVNRNMITAQDYAKRWGEVIQYELKKRGLI